MNNSKIFVGNVPYHCTKQDFDACFRNFDGYINSDIKNRTGTDISRGFGFVLFNNNENAKKILDKPILLKGRKLRISEYGLHKRVIIYSLYVYNLSTNTTLDELKKTFEAYDILEYKLCCKNNNKFGIITLNNIENYYSILHTEIIINGNVLIIKPKNVSNKNKISNPMLAYNQGFQAGKIIGYQEGLNAFIKEHTNK